MSPVRPGCKRADNPSPLSWTAFWRLALMTRSEDAALLFGRLLIAALLLPSGIERLLGFSKFAASLAAKGLPYAKVLAALDVSIEVLGPIALIIGLWPRWVALAGCAGLGTAG